MELIHTNFSYKNVHPVERWVSVVGGSLLAVSGARKGKSGAMRMIAGAALIRRGWKGQCEMYRAFGLSSVHSDATIPYELGIRSRASVTVQEDRQKVYQLWRNFENLPRFMKHVKSVEYKGGVRYHWVVEGVGKKSVEWDADVINEIPNELIAWKSLPGADVDSAGSVHFKDGPKGGTEIHVDLQYNPPGGVVGAYIATLFGREPEQQMTTDLLRMRQYIETGEIATTEGQSKGGERPQVKCIGQPQGVMA